MPDSGAEANKTGRILERFVTTLLTEHGAHIQGYDVGKNNGDLWEDVIVQKNVPYTNMYGGKSHSEFVIDIRSRNFRARIDCRWQESKGSVDEKFPYFIQNAQECYPEQVIWMVVDGGGAKPLAVAWLKAAARNTKSKEILIFTMSEFQVFLRRFLNER